MKLASIRGQGKNQSRDGQLIVVSKDLTKGVVVPEFAMTLQQAIDNWKEVQPELIRVYAGLNAATISPSHILQNEKLLAPLPRAYQWVDGSAYVNHVELVRKARGAVMPDEFWTDPLMYQGGSDQLLGPKDEIVAESEEWGVDFEAEVTVITNDVPMGANIKQAQDSIILMMLVNDVSLRNLIPAELAKGFGFLHSKPSSAFSPVAVTPDELGDSWLEGKVHLPLRCTYNQKLFGEPNAGKDMTFNFPQLICHAAKTRPLLAGTIVGSGTVSNVDRSKGSCCIAEKRMLEKIETDQITTEFMKFNDTVKIEMLSPEGDSIFGAIEQTVVPLVSG
ncbi:MAG: fumarylacetoacetate hydrolase family protein [Pseudomonadales bacterium]|nr:fumarylacetoacetate hydrolase family protein [Pseudomonadales bacterium]